MKYAALIGFALLAGAGHAHAQRVSHVNGTTLMKACTSKSADACDAYVDGFGDAIEAEGKANALACIPRASTGKELRDVLVVYLKAHPEAQHLEGADILTKAFTKAYPCKK